jgi:hypothetical protein
LCNFTGALGDLEIPKEIGTGYFGGLGGVLGGTFENLGALLSHNRSNNNNKAKPLAAFVKAIPEGPRGYIQPHAAREVSTELGESLS